MEENHGNVQELNPVKAEVPKGPQTLEDFKKENEELKQQLTNVINQFNQLRNTWILTRVEFLLKVIASDAFSVSSHKKAVEEVEMFLFEQNKKAEEPGPQVEQAVQV